MLRSRSESSAYYLGVRRVEVEFVTPLAIAIFENMSMSTSRGVGAGIGAIRPTAGLRGQY